MLIGSLSTSRNQQNILDSKLLVPVTVPDMIFFDEIKQTIDYRNRNTVFSVLSFI